MQSLTLILHAFPSFCSEVLFSITQQLLVCNNMCFLNAISMLLIQPEEYFCSNLQFFLWLSIWQVRKDCRPVCASEIVKICRPKVLMSIIPQLWHWIKMDQDLLDSLNPFRICFRAETCNQSNKPGLNKASIFIPLPVNSAEGEGRLDLDKHMSL